jgi:hypothetical protein
MLLTNAGCATGHIYSTLDVQQVQYICPTYMSVEEPCSY